jgi:hypothetical protein
MDFSQASVAQGVFDPLGTINLKSGPGMGRLGHARKQLWISRLQRGDDSRPLR